MKPSEVIDEALTKHIPDEDHWCQGAYHDGQRHCLVGSLLIVEEMREGLVERPRVFASRMAAQYRIYSLLEESATPLAQGIVNFNDAPDTTYDDVRAILEKARASLQEEGF